MFKLKKKGLGAVFVIAVLVSIVTTAMPAHAVGGPSTVTRGAGGLTFQADEGVVNEVSATQIGLLLLISDFSGGIAAPAVTDLCIPFAPPSTVLCVAIPVVDKLTFNLDDLNDTATIGTASLLGVIPALETTINGGEGDDILRGGDGVDTIIGGPGVDAMRGNFGNDTFLADAVLDGPDSMNGGGGTDTADYSARTAAVNVSIDGAANDGFAGELDDAQLTVENLNGGTAGDTLTGSAFVNVINGNGGVDIIDGGLANDTLNGNAGADQIETDATGLLGGGDDAVNGGDDGDTLGNAATSAGNDTMHGDLGNDTIFGGLGDDDLFGDAGDDQIHGGDGNDEIRGGDGFDSLNGDAGNDDIEGGNHGDIIRGGTGDDTLNGNAGNDLIYGDDGNDFCEGDTGIDQEDQLTCESSN